MSATLHTPKINPDVVKALKPLKAYSRGSARGELEGLDALVNRCATNETLRDDLERALVEMARQADSHLKTQVICSRLAMMGSEACVPAMVDQIRIPESFESARAVLAAVAGKQARKALVESIGVLEGTQLRGVVQTLGALREPLAVRPLARLSKASDVLTAAVAIHALGQVGNARCARILIALAKQSIPSLHRPLADALLVCAARLKLPASSAISGGMRAAVEGLSIPSYMKRAAKNLLTGSKEA